MEAQALLAAEAAEEAIALTPAQDEPALPEGNRYGDDQAPPEKGVDLVAIFVVCFAASVPIAVIIYTRIKKPKNETTNA